MEPERESETMFVQNGKWEGSPYTDLSRERPGWTSLLVLAGISTTLGLSVPVGYNIGVMNTPAEVIQHFCNESIQTRYDFVIDKSRMEIVWSCIVSVYLIGAASGSLGGSVLANKIGRKLVLIICTVLAAAAAVSFLTCKTFNSLELLILGRILAGLSSGLTTSVVPMYLMELAPLHLKGAMGVLCPLGVTIGVLLGQIVSMKDVLGNDDYWPHCLAAYSILLVVSAIFSFLPESPNYLYVIRKETDRALKELERLRNTKVIFLKHDIEELKKEDEGNRQMQGASWSIGRVVNDRKLLLPLLLVCCLQAGQQLSGINAVFFYSNAIFKTAGLSQSASELATIGAGIFNFLMAVISIPVMSKVDRRTCILVSMALSIFFLVMLGIAIIFISSYMWVSYVSIVGILGFVISYGIGLGPIPYFVGSELFEVGPRPGAMALGSLSNWGANFIIGLTFPILQLWIGPTCFFILALITAGLYVFIWFYLPETRHKDTYLISRLCQDGFSSRPASKINCQSILSQINDNKHNQDTYI